MTITATEVAELPDLDAPPTCQIIDVDDLQMCGLPADFIARSLCPPCGIRFRDFTCAPCLTGGILCDVCEEPLTVLVAEPLGAGA